MTRLLYRLGKATGEPLLFKGADFAEPEIRPALQKHWSRGPRFVIRA